MIMEYIKEGTLDEGLLSNCGNAKYKYKFEKKMINFPINNVTLFNDNFWDFTSLNKHNRSSRSYRIYFNDIPEQFVFYTKIYMLNCIIKKKNRVSTCISKLSQIKKFLLFVVDARIKDLVLIDKKVLEDYIEYCKEKDIKSIGEVITNLKFFIKSIEEIEKINLLSIIVYLDELKRTYRKSKNGKSLNNVIPNIFLDKLISLAIKDIGNDNCLLNDKIFACLLIILAETGMRIEELTMLETNKLDVRGIGEKQYAFLSFYTFKIEYKETYTWLTPLAQIAYETCEKIVKENYENMDTVKKYRLFHYFLTGKSIKKNLSKTEIEKVNNLDNLTLEEFNSRATKYLWIDCDTGRKNLNTSTYRIHINRFIIRHYKEMNFERLTIVEKEKLKMFEVNTVEKYQNLLSSDEKKEINFENIKNVTFYYANPHMFRVNVCTKLFEQKIPLDYIVKHLNHLTEDMTSYYNKSMQNINRLKESMKILSNIANDEGFLEINEDKLKDDKSIMIEVEKINKFLNASKLNVVKDSDKILKILLKTNTTVEENEFGICIKNIISGICEKRNRFHSILDSSLFSIPLNTYKYLDSDYKRLKEKIKIHNHNVKIYSQDIRYTNEIEREKRALSIFLDKYIFCQVKTLEDDISKIGKEPIIKDYPNLVSIIENIENIKMEMKKWKIE